MVIDDLAASTTRTPIEDDIVNAGLRSLIVAPIVSQDELVGMLELSSTEPGDLTVAHLPRLQEVLPLFSVAVRRTKEELEDRIQAFIKEKCTAIHPSVEWRFRKAVLTGLERLRGTASPLAEIEPIVFSDVYPLYGLSDIRGSSTQRAFSIQSDLLSQLSLARQVVRAAHDVRPLPALDELEREFATAWADPAFRTEFSSLLEHYVGRPTPLTEASRLSAATGLQISIKREDLNHTGAHKINNAIGQALLTLRMGKQRVIAETGAGQHGVATATACALMGLECVVYMGTEDIRRQAPNVERMHLLGAKVEPVEAGARTLKEAVSAAIRDWVATVEDSHYVIGSAVGPAPYPALVRDLQRVIGNEARSQALEAEGNLPERVIACVGGGSNSIGTFYAFLEDPVELIGVEAAGEGIESGRHGATLSEGSTGVLHGAMSAVLADEQGQILEAHSVSAGLDYPGVGPEHAYLRDTGRATYTSVTDRDALLAFRETSKLEGIIPALESSHAIAWLLENGEAGQGYDLLCLSGRGDKDLDEATAKLSEIDAGSDD